MIGLPSGLERVRWKLSESSPQPATTPTSPSMNPAVDDGVADGLVERHAEGHRECAGALQLHFGNVHHLERAAGVTLA